MAKKQITIKVSNVKKDNSAAIKKSEANWQAENEIKQRIADIRTLTKEIREAVSDPSKITADLVQRFNEATSY